MNFDYLQTDFSEKEIKNITEKYNLYLSELRDNIKRDKFIKSRQTYSEELIRFRSICYVVFCFSLYNLLLAIASLTWFKETNLIDFILGSTFTIFIPCIYYSICQSIYESITDNRNKRIKEEINNLSKLYEKNLYEQYERIIENYYRIQAYQVEIKEQQKESKISIIKRLSKMDNEEFKNTIKTILEYEGKKVSYVEIDNCLYRNENNNKVLILCKHIKRSISIVDIKRFENLIEENSFDYGVIYYTGDISTNAVNYCSNKKVPIYLYNELDISDKIYKIENKIKEQSEQEKQPTTTKKMIEESKNNKCPNCGGNLVIRKGKYGKFLGCSNYPKCHYTKGIR